MESFATPIVVLLGSSGGLTRLKWLICAVACTEYRFVPKKIIVGDF